MTYVTETNRIFRVRNNTLFWTGRLLALSYFGFIVYYLFSNFSEASIDWFTIVFLIVQLLFEGVFAFAILLIGSLTTVISDKGIDTYRDLLFFKVSKRHVNPGVYSVERQYDYFGRYKTDKVYVITDEAKIKVIVFFILGSSEDAEKQINDALIHFHTYTAKGMTEENGYVRCPKCNGYILKTNGRCKRCGYHLEGENVQKSAFPDFPTIINIGDEVTHMMARIRISDCHYDPKANSTNYMKEGSAMVTLHNNGIDIYCGTKRLNISFEQLIEMRSTVNPDPESKYPYCIKIEYFDIYKHDVRTQTVYSKQEHQVFVERCMKERAMASVPSGTEYLTFNMMNEKGEFMMDKALAVYRKVGSDRLTEELERLDNLSDSPLEISNEVTMVATGGIKQKKGCLYYFSIVFVAIVILIVALLYICMIFG